MAVPAATNCFPFENVPEMKNRESALPDRLFDSGYTQGAELCVCVCVCVRQDVPELFINCDYFCLKTS